MGRHELLVYLLAGLLVWSGCHSEKEAKVVSQQGGTFTIWLSAGTKDFQGAARVGVKFRDPVQLGNGTWWGPVADLTAPVVKVEPQTLTLSFNDQTVIDHFAAELENGNVALHPCVPNAVC